MKDANQEKLIMQKHVVVWMIGTSTASRLLHYRGIEDIHKAYTQRA